MLGDLREGARRLAKDRGFTLIVLATLALAVGATTTIASFVRGVLLTPPPYHEPERLVRIESLRGGERGQLSLREVRDIEEETTLFAGIAVHSGDAGYNLSGDGRPEEVPAVLCSHNLFEVLGVPLLHGQPWPRSFDRERNYSVVLNHGIFQRRWGGNPQIVGSQLALDGYPGYTIHGVLPPSFDFPVGVELYRSIAFYDLPDQDRKDRRYAVIARLAAGVRLEEAQAQLAAFGERLAGTFPDTNRGIGLQLRPLTDDFVGAARPYLILLAAAVILVLLAACANIVALLLARAAARERELALRRALGATSWRLLRQDLLEHGLLGALGGLAGFGIAALCLPMLRAMLRAELPFWMRIELDGALLGWTLLVAVLATVGAALVPAPAISALNLAHVLRDGSRGSSSLRLPLRRALVVLEVAFAAILLVGALLMVRSFDQLARADLGYGTEDRLTFRVALGWRVYGEDHQTRSFYEQLLERLARLPGVVGAATNSNLPLRGDEKVTVALEGQSLDDQQANPYVNRQLVSHGYLDLMAIPVLAGRQFGPSDVVESPPSALISQSFAQRFWPGEDPIGRRLKLGEAAEAPWLNVVGVVGDVRHHDPAALPGLDVYISAHQLPDNNAFVILRTSGGPAANLAQAATEAVWAVDPNQSNYEIATMAEHLEAKVWQRRLARSLFSLFGIQALILAAVGLYGLMSYSVRRREREMGIRLALGARQAQLLHVVLLEVLRLTGLGLAMGLASTLLFHRLLRQVLYGVQPLDPWTYAAVAALLTAIALAAGWVPARRAAATDPIASLRAE